MRPILLLAAALLPLASLAQQADTVRCAALTNVTLDHAKITVADLIPAAAPIPGTKLTAITAFCRVMIADKPSPDSNILTEVWLPAIGWNGNFHGTGNGGFAGTLLR